MHSHLGRVGLYALDSVSILCMIGAKDAASGRLYGYLFSYRRAYLYPFVAPYALNLYHIENLYQIQYATHGDSSIRRRQLVSKVRLLELRESGIARRGEGIPSDDVGLLFVGLFRFIEFIQTNGQ
jgi:hypothetical protein